MRFINTFFLFTLLLFAANAQAQEDPNYLSFSIGYYDILDNADAVDFRLEYRSGHKYWQAIKPWMGLEVTGDSSFWVGGGILADLKATENVYVVPSFGAGFYANGSSDKDLDYPIEFRSQIEFAYEFEDVSRVGVSFGHLSNASLGDDNPGTEVLSLYYHLPY